MASYCAHFFYSEDTNQLMSLTHDYKDGFTIVDVPAKYYYRTVTILEDGTRTPSQSAPVPKTGRLSVGSHPEKLLTWNNVYHI